MASPWNFTVSSSLPRAVLDVATPGLPIVASYRFMSTVFSEQQLNWGFASCGRFLPTRQPAAYLLTSGGKWSMIFSKETFLHWDLHVANPNNLDKSLTTISTSSKALLEAMIRRQTYTNQSECGVYRCARKVREEKCPDVCSVGSDKPTTLYSSPARSEASDNQHLWCFDSF